jgi:hypothetical protein
MLRVLEYLFLCLFIGVNAVVISCVALAGVADRKHHLWPARDRSNGISNEATGPETF